MNNDNLMQTVSRINQVNRYKKALFFMAGVIVTGGILYYKMNKKIKTIENRLSWVDASSRELRNVINDQNMAFTGFRKQLATMSNEQAKLLDWFDKMDKIIHENL